MIHPDDAFGKVMIENLADRGCLLPGMVDFPNEDAQIKRMKESGFTKVECFNMNVVYNEKLDQTERHRIEKLEIFDEFEEWEMLQHHYCLCLGKRMKNETTDAKIFI
jgi:tRNA wybutosine-synthesizing protein 4